MDSAARRAEYADARFVNTRAERLSTRNGALDQLSSDESAGIGVRVRVGGAWGFAAVRGDDRAGAEVALERALAVAAAAPAANGTALAPEPPAQGSWESPAERDPFSVPLEDKLAVLHGAEALLRSEPRREPDHGQLPRPPAGRRSSPRPRARSASSGSPSAAAASPRWR